MTLKICQLVSGDLWAGAEVMASNLLSGLSTLSGVDLFVIILNKGRLSDELQDAGIPTCVLDEKKQSFLEIVGIATKAMKSWAPDVLHSHRYKENILAYLVSLTLRENAALVSTQHGMPEFYDIRPNLWHRLKSHANYRLLATKFDKTVAVSADIRELLIRSCGFHEKHLETIHNGIAIPEIRDRSREKSGFVIGSAGRFFPVKDYPFMVEVAKEVNAATDKIRFELAGAGPTLGDIQDRIGKYDLDERFMLRGFVDDTSTFYEELDVYLNTSLHEGIPMSVLEAMACAVPPVVPRVGGLVEIVTDGVDGYLVDGRKPRDFSEKCLALYKNEALRRSMARAAREKIIGKFSIERMVNAYLSVYTRSVEESRQGTRQRRLPWKRH